MNGFVHIQKGKKSPLKISIGGEDYLLIMRKNSQVSTLCQDGNVDSAKHCEFEVNTLGIAVDDERFDQLKSELK